MIHLYLMKLVAESCKEEIANVNKPTYDQSMKIKLIFEGWFERMEESEKLGTKMSESEQVLVMIQIKLYLKCKYTHPEVFI